MAQKLVVVAGATGTQGGAAIDALLAHGGYIVRGLTRNTSSAAAKALTDRGVEMVQASPMDKQSLIEAFKGAYAVFGVAVSFTKDDEAQMGRNLVDACVADHVPLFVWSSLPSAEKVSRGKYHVRAMDEKAEVDEYIKTVGQPTVILWPGVFTENLLNHMDKCQLQPVSEDGKKWEIRYPVVPAHVAQPTTYVTKDSGAVLAAIIDHWENEKWRERLTKEPILQCSYVISGEDMCRTIEKVTGKEVTWAPYDNLPPPVKALYSLAAEFQYDVSVPTPLLLELGVKFHTFEDYVRDKVAPHIEEVLSKVKAV
ncbi:NADP-binding protein [Dacryopinax primogenitus]|uniref:NADP-binding protein n=1 Tax=Dacryopinax primogenitus (strain DJM 731) TaxID=1858805 RepID=M5FZS7_DACPD|nr:NADP-binding protein [Dacryopinax primogenitus]EJU01395.1 NADP-binding protein [Dacryopinax primogenitus]